MPLGLVIPQCVWDGGTACAHGINWGEALDTHIVKKKKNYVPNHNILKILRSWIWANNLLYLAKSSYYHKNDCGSVEIGQG